MKTCVARILPFLLLALTGVPGFAENWPQWRGPSFNGSSTEKNLPIRFSKSDGVKWSSPMPGPSAATPIIWDDRVFVSSTDATKKSLVALCLDRRTGKKIWQHEVSPDFAQDDKSNYASPSPVTDGARVFFFYGNGELVAFDLDGKKQWARNIQKDYGTFAFQWTFSSSPTLTDGKLILQVLQRNEPVQRKEKASGPIESYLLALNPETGKEIWRITRPSEARAESLEAFSTPIPFEHGPRKELLVVGGDCITGHDIGTGRELWRWGTWNPTRITHWRLVPSPVAGNGVVLACAPKQEPIFALKAGASGNLDDSAVLWKSKDRSVSADVATPLFYKNRFYILNGNRKKIFCVEPRDGKIIWSGELDSRGADFEASPTAADGKIFFMNHRGEVFVLEAGDEFKMLHKTALGDEGDTYLRASIPLSQGNLFVRTGRQLYCIGQ